MRRSRRKRPPLARRVERNGRGRSRFAKRMICFGTTTSWQAGEANRSGDEGFAPVSFAKQSHQSACGRADHRFPHVLFVDWPARWSQGAGACIPTRRRKSSGQIAALIFEPLQASSGFLLFESARLGQAAAMNELDDPAKFILVEPRAVLRADIHHHMRTARKVHAVHQLAANRTWPVTDVRLDVARQSRGQRGRHAEHGGLLLGVGADLVDLQALREGNDYILTERARQYLEIVRTARQEK